MRRAILSGLFLSGCHGGTTAPACGDGVLLVDQCGDFGSEDGREPVPPGGGFASLEDTGSALSEDLLVNGGFEDGVLSSRQDATTTPGGWTADGSPLWLRVGDGLDAGTPHSGSAVEAVALSSGLRQRVAHSLTFDDRYLFRVWARSDAVGTATLAVTTFDEADVATATTAVPITGWTEWRSHIVGAAGLGTTSTVEVAIEGTTTTPVQLDDLRLELLPPALVFDLGVTSHTFAGVGAHVWPHAIDPGLVATTLAALDTRFVRVEADGLGPVEVEALRSLPGGTDWLLTLGEVPAEFLDGQLLDVDGFAHHWAATVEDLDTMGIRPTALELLREPDAGNVDGETYGTLATRTREALDASGFTDVRIAGPGTSSLLETNDTRDRILALGSDPPLDVWGFHTAGESAVCPSCLGAGWSDVLGAIHETGAFVGRAIWLTELSVEATTFHDVTWPSPDDRLDLNSTWTGAHATALVESLLVSIHAGAERVYLRSVVDDASQPLGGWGLVSSTGIPKPSYLALAGLLPLLQDGASVIAAPAQGSTRYGALFETAEHLVFVYTNEEDRSHDVALTLVGMDHDPKVLSAASTYPILDGNPELGTPDTMLDVSRTLSFARNEDVVEILLNVPWDSVTLVVMEK